MRGATVPKFEVGQRVEVSTRPYPSTGPTVRDATSGWGFALNEWREATISAAGDSPRGGRYTVQFREGDCHWSFSEHEIREPRGSVLVRVELRNGDGKTQVMIVGGDTTDDAVRVAEEAANSSGGDWAMNEWGGL